MPGKRAEVSKEALIELYIAQQLSLGETAKRLGVCGATVHNYLKRYGIAIRTLSEALQTDLAGQIIGDWEVTHEKGYTNGQKHLRWKCLCRICKKFYWVLARTLYTETSTRCLSCRRKQRRAGYQQLHGSHWSKILDAAATRNIEVAITIEYAWSVFEEQGGKCKLSGLPLVFGYKKEATASLDRIDNTKGYLPGNVQWVHKDINRMKWAYTQDYFIQLCRGVAKTSGHEEEERQAPSDCHGEPATVDDLAESGAMV